MAKLILPKNLLNQQSTQTDLLIFRKMIFNKGKKWNKKKKHLLKKLVKRTYGY